MKIVFNILSCDYEATDAQIDEYCAELKKEVEAYYPEAKVRVKRDSLLRADNADLRTTDVSFFGPFHRNPRHRECEIRLYCDHLRNSVAEYCNIKKAR